MEKAEEREELVKTFVEDIANGAEELYKKGYYKGYEDATKEEEVDLLGRENIDFSLVKDLSLDDDRLDFYRKQRLERGFDNTELWNLDHTILEFILPRLKAFKEVHKGWPADLESDEEWQKVLQSMIDFIESFRNEDSEPLPPDHEGWSNFHKYFFSLWY